MEFGVLGPLVVRKDGEDVGVGALKRRVLLVRLLVDANRTVSAERLVEDLWEGAPPASAAQTLQSYVSQLRRLIGADRLVTRAGGYELVVHPGELDATAFDAELDAARADPGQAAALLDAALARWRGPALADAAGAPWALAPAARLEELRLVALEARLDAYLDAGQHERAVAFAESAVAEHPLRERLWGQLMLALYRSGRQAEALRAYQRLRTHLADELGIDPSAELVDLEARVLRQDASLDHRPTSGPPTLPSGVVTFLLTDVVGSTRLWEESPHAMADALAVHDQLIGDAVRASGGVLLKARGEGDSTFSVFRRATDAVAAALAAQETLVATPWPASCPVRVRMAIHTGEALERDGDYYGRTVNRVARLRAVADAGQVLVSQVTSALVLDHLPDGIELVELGPHDLRDLDRPEMVFLLARAGAAATPPRELEPVPVPQFPVRLVRPGFIGFVGRSDERRMLQQAYKDAAGGDRRVVLLAGEAGIGKTSLVAEVATDCYGAGALVLYGRCDEDLRAPYQPFIEALDAGFAQLDADAVSEHAARFGGDLSRLLPAAAGRLPAPRPGDPETERYLLFGAVADAIARLAADRPVVLILDDLHWADRTTLLLLRHVAGSELGRVLVLATYRDTDVGIEHPLVDVLAALRRERGVDRISLVGLGDTELVELARAGAGHELDDSAVAVAHAVRRESNGNPFFAMELLRHLSETGAIAQGGDGRWEVRADLADLGLPDSVREVVGRRVARLGEPVRTVLNAAAVIGNDVDVDLLAAVCAVSQDDLVGVVEKAVDAGVLVEVPGHAGRFDFSHALVQQTLYDDLGDLRRARLHQRAAQALEARRGRATEVARHWLASGNPDTVDLAIEAARRAGDEAYAALAPDESVRWFGEALTLVDRHRSADIRLRGQVLVGLGRAQLHAGDAAFRETLLEAARIGRRTGDSELLADAALANTTGRPRFIGINAEELEMVRAALAVVGEGDASGRRARLLAILAGQLDPADWRARRELAAQAVAAARRTGDDAVLAHVLTSTYLCRAQPDLLPERLALTEEAIAVAERVGDPSLVQRALFNRFHPCIEAGDLAGADAALERLQEFDERYGRYVVFQGALALTWRELLAGRAGAAETHARAFLEIGESMGIPETQMGFWSMMLVIRRHQGRSGEVIDDLVRRTETGPDWRSRWLFPYVLAEAGSSVDASRLADLLAAEALPEDVSWLAAVANLADAAVTLGDRDAAADILERLEPYAERVAINVVGVHGCVARPLGRIAALLGRYDTADAYFRTALEVNGRLDAPYWIARTELDWAEMLLAKSDVARAHQLIDAAVTRARQFGCGGLERRAASMLRPALPARVAVAATGAIVGRGAERDALSGRVGGSSQLALVAGEPGIGKTRLVADVAAAAHAAGAWVLHGASDEGLRVPFQPFVDAIGQLIRFADDAVLDRIGDRQLAELTRLVPAVADRRPGLSAPLSNDAETDRYLLMNAVAAALAAAAARQPVVLVLDDLHWADSSTLLLLRHLVAAAPDARVLVLGTYRDSEPSTELDAVLAALRRLPNVSAMKLEGLSDAEVAALTGADRDLASVLHRETQGNPFFVGELHRHVVETGAGIGDVPDTVRGVVGQRIARLGDAVLRALTAAAVIGPDFELDLLVKVLSERDDAVLEAIEAAEAASLVVTVAPGRFAFAHALVQHTLYDELTPTRRARWHRQVAEALDEARVPERARHWLAAAASPADAAVAVEHAVAAGEHAMASLAPDEAVRWYRRALELVADDSSRCGVLVRLVEAEAYAGEPSFRDTRREAARLAQRLGEVEGLVRAVLADVKEGPSAGRVDRDVVDLLEVALASVPPGDSKDRAMLSARLSRELSFAPDPRREPLREESMAMARRLGDPVTFVEVVDVSGYVTHGGHSGVDQFLEDAKQATAIADALGNPFLSMRAARTLMRYALKAGQRDVIDDGMARMERICDEVGGPVQRWYRAVYRCGVAILDGSVEDAERWSDESVTIGREIGWDDVAAVRLNQLTAIRWHQGRQAELVDAFAELSKTLPDMAALRVPVTQAASAAPLPEIPDDVVWPIAKTAIAEVVVRRGDRAAAAGLYDELLPWEACVAEGNMVCRGSFAHYLGALATVLGRYDDADAHFVKADDVHARLRAPFHQARTWLEWGRLLLERNQPGDAARARQLLERARDTAARYGCAQVQRRAERLLA